MKYRIIGLVAVLLSSVLATLAESGIHVFTDSKGRAIAAKIISFDAIKGQIQIEREDGQRFSVSPGMFSEDDQAYIKQWIAADRVLSDKHLRVSFDKDKVESFKNGLTDNEDAKKHSKGQILRYDITLKNKAKKPVEGLKLEYRYFVMVTTSDGESIKKMNTRTVTVDRIEAGEDYTFTTADLTIAVKYNRTKVEDPSRTAEDVVAYEYEKVSEDELLGIWLKVYGPAVGNEPSVRDISDPEDLLEEYNWDGEASG